MTKEGLYLRFHCRCHLSGTVMHRILVQAGENTLNLGILVPENGDFALNTRVPAGKLGNGIPEFRAVPHIRKKHGLFCPIYPEEPFAYLAEMRKAHTERRDGKLGIVLEEPGKTG